MEKGPAPPSYDDTFQQQYPSQQQYPPVGGQPVYPPQPGVPVAQPGMTSQPAVVVQQPGTVITVVQQAPLGSRPAAMTCPHCRAQITTTVEYENGLLAWAAAGILCVLGCWLGCCLIPFCIDDCKDAHHYCPNCKALVGRYKRIH